MAERVLISGASGFIASHTIEQLLAAGYEVVGTVRDPKATDKLKHLTELPGAAERLSLVAADLNDANPFDNYVNDVDYVLHMASPYALDVKDAQRDLVDPAVRGTNSMLAACAKSTRIKRVILTSSIAAITDEPDSNKVLTEADWNEKSSLTRNPYYYSKTLAEKAAWSFVKEHKPSWKLVAINPFLVLGPAKNTVVNESVQVFRDMLRGGYPAIMDLTFGIVDVRDVAKAHVLAMTSAAAEGRYLCCADTIPMRAAVEHLRANGYANYKLPKIGLDNAVGNVLMCLASYTQPKFVGTYLRSHLGRVPRLDNSKIKKDLGMEFRPIRQSILDTCADLKRWKHIK